MTNQNLLPADVLVVIPARFKSTRLPGKPLIEIAGKSMIVRTAEQCLQVATPDQLVVATDDERIANECESHGINVEITSPDHPTGTDRVAEVAQRRKAGLYVNVQGDEPVFNPADILTLASFAERDSKKTYIGYCEMTQDEWLDSKNIKLLFGVNNQLIYIGRAQVPGSHDGKFRLGYRQVCAYAYSSQVLANFASTKGRTPLESIEDNEVMRFLELGMAVEVVKLSGDSISVDKQGDLQRVVERINSWSK